MLSANVPFGNSYIVLLNKMVLNHKRVYNKFVRVSKSIIANYAEYPLPSGKIDISVHITFTDGKRGVELIVVKDSWEILQFTEHKSGVHHFNYDHGSLNWAYKQMFHMSKDIHRYLSRNR